MMIQGYAELFAGVIAATFVIYLLIAVITKQKSRASITPATENRPEAAVLLRFCHLLWFWSLFLILFATILLFNLPFVFSPELSALNLRPLEWLREGNIGRSIITQIGPNILLFVPFGFFTPVAFRRMRRFYRTVLLVFAVTFGVEFFQYFIGRSSDVDDVIANLAGGVIGYGIFKILYSRNR